jgi:hypothetical protein
MDWSTESGDRGVAGYWTTKPTMTQRNAYIKAHYPDDYESETFYFEIVELTVIA